MHPIRRELEFSLFRATSVPAFAPPAHVGRLGRRLPAGRRGPGRAAGPREGRWGRVPAPPFRVRLLRFARSPRAYSVSAIRYVGVYARIGVALAAVAPDRYFACRNRDER